MRVTRSATASASASAAPQAIKSDRDQSSSTTTAGKEQLSFKATKRANTTTEGTKEKKLKLALEPAAAAAAVVQPLALAPAATAQVKDNILLHPPLTFSYPCAISHLTSLDPRWTYLTSSLRCTPFQGADLSPFNPFKSLVSSIIGQQVSWLAARSIQHKFCRVFFPQLPEKRDPPGSSAPESSTEEGELFPTPAQVLALPERTATLRSAGLSGRKVEYIVELAERFEDGRLTAEALWKGDDQSVEKMLVECRGIGIWTVHMFLIFSLKRPNILPVGDLGVQKALCRWYADSDPSLLPSGSGGDNKPRIHKRKEQQQKSTKESRTPPATVKAAAVKEEEEAYPTPSSPAIVTLDALGAATLPSAAEVVLPDVVGENLELKEVKDTKEEVKREDMEQDKAQTNPVAFTFPKTTAGHTAASMRARLGKKIKGNIYLTPLEMTELMAPFEPYRSVACWYLWSLADGTGDP